MENPLEIVLSFAVLPVFGLMQYVWIRVVELKVRGFAAGTIQVCKALRILAPLVVFFGTTLRYVGTRAKVFVPDNPPTAIEMVWTPMWVFAAVWVVMFAARRAGKEA